MPLADSEMEKEELITRQRSVGSVIGGAVGSMVKSISSSDAKGADAPKEDDQDGMPEKSPEEKKKAEEEAKKVAEALAKQKQAAKLRKGDYVVQVHVIEARDLKGRDWGGISDPVCVVSCMKQKRATKIFKKMSNCVWDEVITFEFSDLDVVEVEQAQINISVYDANVVTRDELIGSYNFDLASIYAQPNHEVFRRWLALSDVTDENEGIQGYLQVTAVVLGPDDEQVTHPPGDYDDAGSSMLAVLLPPHLEAETRMMRISVYDVRDMPQMDEGFAGGYCDPYAKVEFAGVTCKSKRMSGKDVDINQVMCVPVMEPILANFVKFSMYDWDATSTDDRIATVNLDYEQMKNAPYRARWIQLYGAPEDHQTGWASKMNRGAIPGSSYRGRVLIGAEVEKVKDPKLTCDDTALNEVHRPRLTKYIIQFDLYEGSEMPNNEVWVEVSCMRTSMRSSKSKAKNGISTWYEELQLPVGGDMSVEMPEDLDQCADVFVYLCTSKGRISFRRYTARYLLEDHKGWRAPPRWHSLNECMAMDAFNDGEFPGALLFSLRMGPASTVPAEPFPEARPLRDNGVMASLPEPPAPVAAAEASALVRQPTIAQPSFVPYLGKLTVSILSAKNLPALDDGSSDPFCKIVVGSTEKSTQVKEKSLSPIWNETFTYDSHHIDTPVTIKIYDWNKLMKNTKMGEFNVHLRAVTPEAPGKDFVVVDDFTIGDQYPNAVLTVRLRMEYSSKAQHPVSTGGVVQASSTEVAGSRISDRKSSTNVVSSESKNNRVLGRPNHKQYQLRVHIYQARKLPGLDDSGLSDPYLVISCGGKRVTTEIVNETLFPTWYKTYCLNVNLPYPLEFATPIMIRAFDHDTIGRDEVMGRVQIPILPIRDVSKDPATRDILQPAWYHLRDNNNVELSGEILAAFQLLDVKDSAVMPLPNLRPDSKPYWLEFITLGCRDLNSTLKLYKPQVDFECPQNDNTTKRFSTLPSNVPSAENPNFLQVIKIPIGLPIDPLFAPVISISVRDTLLGGLIKRLIGTSALDLSKLLVDEDNDGTWDSGKPLRILSDHEVSEEQQLERERKIEKARLERLRREEEAEKRRQEENAKKAALAAERQLQKSKTLAAAQPAELSYMAPAEVAIEMNTVSDKEVAINVEADDVELLGGKAAAETDNSPLLKRLGSTKEAKNSFLDSKPKDTEDDIETRRKKVIEEEEAKRLEEERLMEEMYDCTKLDVDAPFVDPVDSLPDYMIDRETIDDELEDSMDLSPFTEFPLYTGDEQATLKSMRRRKIGKLKGLVRLMDEKTTESHIDLSALLRPKEVFVRLYVLQGHRLTPKDNDGTSDPYLVIKLGDQVISTRSRYQKSTLDPDFFEFVELSTSIPGQTQLIIECWDWDGIYDDLIGITTIDLEDRWFTKEWRAMERKPVEMRTLHAPTSSAAQGKLSMFLEVLTADEAKRQPVWNIKPPPAQPYEMRVIIWGCKGVPILDTLTQKTDLYVTGSVDDLGHGVVLPTQSTDTHLRSRGGVGNFNWRMKFPINLPSKRTPRLRLQVWDMDFFSANESLCETYLSLRGLCSTAVFKKGRVKLMQKDEESPIGLMSDKITFRKLTHPNVPNVEGSLTVSIELMPLSVAQALPAGLGRDAPNSNPHLAEPPGRVDWSLFHPIDMCYEILGDNICKKLLLLTVLAALASAIYFLAPMIVSQIVANKVTGK